MNPLSDIIRREIAQRGVLSFARFMELALYCPKHGYYETKKDNPGRRGDFYTSVSVGKLFGQLLAFQFTEWLTELRSADRGLRIVEAGAHDGRLAKDILGWLQTRRPELINRLEYWLIEPSARRREWQQETLREFGSRVRWFDSLQAISFRNPKSEIRNPKSVGVIFSNELLDAMPVRRFGWDATKKEWFEWGVTFVGEKFAWVKMPQPASRNPHPEVDLPSSLLAVLPDGYTIETGSAAECWWREAAGVLANGKLMAIDYGLTAGELFSPARPRGTLRAYYRHHVSDDLLANVGEQDLTAHVNFSVIQRAGEKAGLQTESVSTQSQFLTRILAKAAKDDSFGQLTTAQARQFQTLAHPEHLGRAFRVLVQSRFSS
jgi:SAM-dependent MidA family methyltransferase